MENNESRKYRRRRKVKEAVSMQPLKQDRNFLLLILLSAVTCGIYGIYYWYKFVEDLNTLGEGDGEESPNYVVVLLSIVTCGIYNFIWYYKQGNRMQKIGQRNGVQIDENGTSLLLWLLVGSLVCGVGALISTYMMTRNMNKLCTAYNAQFGGPVA